MVDVYENYIMPVCYEYIVFLCIEKIFDKGDVLEKLQGKLISVISICD